MKIIILLQLVCLIAIGCNGQQTYKQSLSLMGCDFEVTVVAADSIAAHAHIVSAVDEIKRIEDLISSWDPNSQTSAINQNAGIKPVEVDRELYLLIERSMRISSLTDGAFDISYASMDRIWKFDGSMKTMPSPKEIGQSVDKVGYQNIILDPVKGSVFLRDNGMKIGFGAIGKGYAADKAKDLLISKGITSGIINASGDMTTWGVQPNGTSWKVAITNPLDRDKVFAILPVTNGAVVTSGDYEKHVTFNGKRYTHIIDPRTGSPTHGIVSVTVFAPKAELADALATSVFVLGTETGMDRINQLPNIECIIIDDEGNIIKSDNIEVKKL